MKVNQQKTIDLTKGEVELIVANSIRVEHGNEDGTYYDEVDVTAWEQGLRIVLKTKEYDEKL